MATKRTETYSLNRCPKCGNEACMRVTVAQAMCSSFVCGFEGVKARTVGQAANLWNALGRSEMPKKPSVPIYHSQLNVES